MLNKTRLSQLQATPRDVRTASGTEPDLGPLQNLPGSWKNVTEAMPERFVGRGWNLIALPFEEKNAPSSGAPAPDPDPFDFRVLVNQYNETLNFTEIDGPVPNRGINKSVGIKADQFIFALDYTQSIKQIAAADSPESGQAGAGGLPIHHEPGFFLHITNETATHQDGVLDVARLGSIPHGNGVLTMGWSRSFDGPPRIPPLSGMPIGVPQNIDSPYLAAYKAFSGANAFKGVITAPSFPGFDVSEPNKLLELGMPDNVKHTTELHFDTKYAAGNIVNVPFVERQADASEMIVTFWIMELDETDASGQPVRVLAYSQLVFLDFFPRRDGVPGLIRWPHVSINMMVLDTPPPSYQTAMEKL